MKGLFSWAVFFLFAPHIARWKVSKRKSNNCPCSTMKYSVWLTWYDTTRIILSSQVKSSQFLAGPQRASPNNAKVCHWVSEWVSEWVSDWVMKLQDWSADCWSFLIGRCSFKMKRRRTVLCLRFLGSVSAVQCNSTLCCCCACAIVYVRLSYVMLCFVLCYRTNFLLAFLHFRHELTV